jgi:hypothetical protein
MMFTFYAMMNPIKAIFNIHAGNRHAITVVVCTSMPRLFCFRPTCLLWRVPAVNRVSASVPSQPALASLSVSCDSLLTVMGPRGFFFHSFQAIRGTQARPHLPEVAVFCVPVWRACVCRKSAVRCVPSTARMVCTQCCLQRRIHPRPTQPDAR